MTNSAQPVQDYMLQLAAAKLTPEKFALLQYKLMSRSPTAMKIMQALNPGEWEIAVSGRSGFDRIQIKLVTAIDAWFNSNPTSKGFVWPIPGSVAVDQQNDGQLLAISQKPKLNLIDRTTLATPDQLVEAFGIKTNMAKKWFENPKDYVKLANAKKIAGIGGINHSDPLYCPFKVLQWLSDPKRKCGKKAELKTLWHRFKLHFPKAYKPHCADDPNND